MRDLGRLRLGRGLLFLAEWRNVCAWLHFGDMIVVMVTVVVIAVVMITMRLRGQVLVRVHLCLLMFVLFVMCVIMGMGMIMCVLHMPTRMFMVTTLCFGVIMIMFCIMPMIVVMIVVMTVVMIMVMSCRCTSSWTGSSGVLGASCRNLLCVWMVGARLVVWMTMPVTVTCTTALTGG